jgi:creatinine amidohydrolase
MSGHEILLERLSWPEVRNVASGESSVVIPVGSIEQHGPHLPLLVDAAIARLVSEAAARKVCDQISVIVAPTLVYGLSEEHMGFPGTVTVCIKTFMDMAKEVVVSLTQHGFERFLFLNAHAGNIEALKLVARSVRKRHKCLVAVSSYWEIAYEGLLPLRRGRGGGPSHGGEEETSLMLYLQPDLVDMSTATPNPIRWRSPYLSGDNVRDPQVAYGRLRTDIAPQGHNGDPTLASSANGELLFGAIVDGVARFLLDFHTWRLDEMVNRQKG